MIYYDILHNVHNIVYRKNISKNYTIYDILKYIMSEKRRSWLPRVRQRKRSRQPRPARVNGKRKLGLGRFIPGCRWLDVGIVPDNFCCSYVHIALFMPMTVKMMMQRETAEGIVAKRRIGLLVRIRQLNLEPPARQRQTGAERASEFREVQVIAVHEQIQQVCRMIARLSSCML